MNHRLPEGYAPSTDLLKDRVILVTGAGDGIGRAAALGLAAHGATIVLLGKTVPKLEAVYDTIEAAGGPTPAIYPIHLEGAGPHDFDELARVLDENFGRLDGLIHNAAILPYLSRIKDYEPEDWMRVMQTNLNAPFLLTQACIGLLEKSRDASLLFTLDAAGMRGKAFYGAYGVSKAALLNLAQILAEELEQSHVRVNSFDPGPTLTALRKRVFPGEPNDQLKSPDTLVAWYLWLMGSDSAGVDGQHIPVE